MGEYNGTSFMNEFKNMSAVEVLKDVSFNDENMLWYVGFSDDKERTKDICYPKSAKDYLDHMRVDYILDHSRVYRVFHHKKLAFEKLHLRWDIRYCFSNTHYETFLKNLPSFEREKCQKITYGDMYSKQVNAFAFPHDEWGDFVSVNIAVKFFAYYMLLALYEPLRFEIPAHVIIASLRIAIRTWLGTETLDFEIDPRGIVPKEIDDDINSIIPNILIFVAGHEFSHHLLGHCDKNNLRSMIMWGNDESHSQKIYNTSQQQELDADLGSLEIPDYSNTYLKQITESALIWYLMLDIVEHAMSIINPFYFDGLQTHPKAKDRYEHILNNSKYKEFFEDYLNPVVTVSENLKSVIEQDISENYGLLYDDDKYGSIYLDVPNTKWRGKELIDRVDY